jgi:hypothetical protein
MVGAERYSTTNNSAQRTRSRRAYKCLNTKRGVIFMAYAAMRTKFLSATNSRGERVKATLENRPDFKSEIAPYDYALSAFENHKRVAQVLADRFFNHYAKADEPITLVAGEIKRGYFWLCTHPRFFERWVRVSDDGINQS